MNQSDILRISGLATIFGGMALVFSMLVSLNVLEVSYGIFLLIPIFLGGFLLIRGLMIEPNELQSNRNEEQ